MRVLMINKYLFPKGGDAICTLETGRLLQEKGHEVIFWGMDHPRNPELPLKEYFVRNVDYHQPGGPISQFRMAANLLYSFEAKHKLESVLQAEKPDVVHLHNYAHQISPSILHTIRRHGIPAVATLHDAKLVCASYLLRCGGDVCDACGQGKYYQCAAKRCVKSSWSKSLLGAIEMYLHHDVLGLYEIVGTHIAPSLFLKRKVEDMGFGGDIVHLPNFIDTAAYRPQYGSPGRSIVYVGRLSEEKGLFTLLDAVGRVRDVTVKIIGEGPLMDALKRRVAEGGLHQVKFLGYRSGENLLDEIASGSLVVLPSECHENNPRAVLEAFALGKPVIGSRLGGIPELVIDGLTGLTFTAKNADELSQKIDSLMKAPEAIMRMGRNARKLVEEGFNSEVYYQGLMRVYAAARERQ
ncbi:MAG: glycosyltransferase family 4 protein [Deltaproteobacteria bacterium]|nr:glycosyltransferase family 4 protein [Deltaproteobacteria bacterium]